MFADAVEIIMDIIDNNKYEILAVIFGIASVGIVITGLWARLFLNPDLAVPFNSNAITFARWAGFSPTGYLTEIVFCCIGIYSFARSRL